MTSIARALSSPRERTLVLSVAAFSALVYFSALVSFEPALIAADEPRLLPSFAAVPNLSALVFSLTVAAAAWLFAKVFGFERAQAFAFAALFVSNPIWPHQDQPLALAGIGVLLTAVATTIVLRGSRSHAVLGGVVAAIAIALHPSLAALFACALALDGLLHVGRNERPTQASLRHKASQGVLAMSVALVLARPSIDGAHLAELATHADEARARIAPRLAGVTLGGDPVYAGWGAALLAIAWLGAARVSWRWFITLDEESWRGGAHFVWCVAATLAAFATIIFSAGHAATTSACALVLLYAVAGTAGWKAPRWLRSLRWVLLAYALLVNTWIATRRFNTDAVARQRDAMTATLVAQRIADLRPTTPAGYVTLGESPGVARYLEALAVRGLERSAPSTLRSHAAAAAAMPVWPASGSVALLDRTLVIKLAPLSAEEQRALAPPITPCNLETFNDVLTVRRGETANVGGWVIDPSRERTPTNASLALEKAGERVTIPIRRYLFRPDVAKSFANPGYTTAGFVVAVPADRLAAGRWQLSVVFDGSAGAVTCNAHRTLEVVE